MVTVQSGQGGAPVGQACTEQAGLQDDHVMILMATRNGMPWLAAQLDSLVAQTHRNWTLWVSDDGSTDATRDTLNAFDRAHPGRLARLVEGPRQGAAANFLQLVCHPDRPAGMVAFCDQDDVWMPDKLARAVACLQGLGAAPAVWACRYRVTDHALLRGDASPLWPHPPSLENAVVQNILSGHSLTLNAAAAQHLRAAGPVDVPHHDWWTYLVMAATGARMILDPAILLEYRQHGANTMGAGGKARKARFAAVLDGTLGRWIGMNLQALTMAEVPLTAQAAALVTAWRDPALARAQVLRQFGIHRQSRAETGLLYLAAWLGRL
jgi:glycosyltransferase involved in cell wall biosynthesis